MDDNLAWAIGSTIKRYCSPADLARFDLAAPIRDGRLGGPAIVWLDDERPFALGTDASELPEEYVICDLAGIETHTELVAVVLPTSAVSSLTPLAHLGSLRLLVLGVTPDTDLSPLFGLGELARCAVRGPVVSAGEAVLDALSGRGVHVDRLDVEPDWKALAAPFVDWRFKLAVLHALVEAGRRAWPTVHPVDLDCLDKFNLARVLNTEPTAEELESIESVRWEGSGLAIHRLLWPQWDGESEEFAIVNLEGVEHLPNLRRIQLSRLPDGFGRCKDFDITVEKL